MKKGLWIYIARSLGLKQKGLIYSGLCLIYIIRSLQGKTTCLIGPHLLVAICPLFDGRRCSLIRQGPLYMQSLILNFNVLRGQILPKTFMLHEQIQPQFDRTNVFYRVFT
jgi:hypothetical protein